MTDKTLTARAELAASILPAILAAVNRADSFPTYECPLTGTHFEIWPRICEDIDGPEELRYALDVRPRSGRRILYNVRDHHHGAVIIADEVASALTATKRADPSRKMSPVKTFLISLVLLFSAAAPSLALTADEMREISRANIDAREVREAAEDAGITVLSGATTEELRELVERHEKVQDAQAPNRAAYARARARITCKRFGAVYDYYTTSRAIYLLVDGDAYQVLPGNEAILQDGNDVLFTGVSSGDHTRGDFRIPNARVADVMEIYFSCRY